jgi:FkbM family methyltransferase
MIGSLLKRLLGSSVSSTQTSRLGAEASESLGSFDSLAEHIDSCRVYRRGLIEADLRTKPICVCCESRDVEAAVLHFRKTYDLEPAVFAIVQKRADWLRGMPVPNTGRTTIALADLVGRKDLQPVVFVQAPRERTLCRLIAEYGIRDVLIWQEPIYANSLSPRDYFEQNREALESVYSLLEDQESKETFASVLRQRRENHCGYLRLAEYPEYEHPSCLAEPGDTVIDGGGFDGQTSIRFAKHVGSAGKVYCFEPVSKNLQLIRKTMSSLSEKKLIDIIQVVEMGVGLCEESVSIAVAGGSSKIEGSGGMSAGAAAEHEVIQVTSLDAFWESTDRQKLDLISLDIEGLEMAALKGAEGLIRRYRPKLQISLYHKPEDLYELPLWIHSLNLGYRFYIGHHDTFLVETDLYATCR